MISAEKNEPFLTRQAAADALTASGFPTTKKTLDTLASRGGGPVYRLWGKKPLYTLDDLLKWAESRMSGPVTTTCEARRAA